MHNLPEKQIQQIMLEEPERVEKILRAIETITPKRYICYRASGPITVDGHLDEPSWKKAPWTD